MNDKTIEVNLYKLAGSVTAAIFAAAAIGFFGAVNALNSDHFSLIALASRVERIETNHVTQAEFTPLQSRLERIETKLDRLIEMR